MRLLAALGLFLTLAPAALAARPHDRACGKLDSDTFYSLSFPKRHWRAVSCRTAHRVVDHAKSRSRWVWHGWSCRRPRAGSAVFNPFNCTLDGGGTEPVHATVSVSRRVEG